MKEILIKGQLYKFKTFAEFAEEFQLGSEDLILTNEYIYEPFMKELNLDCQIVFQEKFGSGEPSEEMITDCLLYTSPLSWKRACRAFPEEKRKTKWVSGEVSPQNWSLRTAWYRKKTCWVRKERASRWP